MGKEAELANRPHLEIIGTNTHENRIRIEVVNTGRSVARGCYGKITIDHKREDVIEGQLYKIDTFVKPKEYAQVDKADVSWAYSGQPARMNIPVGGAPERLQIAWLRNLETKGYADHTIYKGRDGTVTAPSIPQIPPTSVMGFEIPSEDHDIRRVLLKARTYAGSLLIGANDIPPITRKFRLGYIEDKKEAFFELLAD